MIIREYRNNDEKGWVRCRLLSFLDCSYYDDVRQEKELYEHPSICLIAEDNGITVGLIDVEYEEFEGDVCYFDGGLGAVIWHIGIIPEYRRQGIATELWNTAKVALLNKGITRVEVWTQDDEAANEWYKRNGFEYKEAYLNAFIKGTSKDDIIREYIRLDIADEIFGIRCLNFEAPLDRKDELEKICYRLHEVRVYELIF